MSESTAKQLQASIDELSRDWEEFKATLKAANDSHNSDTREKLDKINDSMSDAEEKIAALENQLARENNGGSGDAQAREYRAAFETFARTGDDEAVRDMAVRGDLSTSVDSEGAVTLPEELDREILSINKDISSMRPHVTVKTIGGANYKKLVKTSGVDSGWVGEKEARPKTGSPAFESLGPKMGEVYANPAATQGMLDDAFFSVEELLVEDGGFEFIDQEEQKFVSGTGVDQPIGLLAGTMNYLDDDSRDFGVIQKIKTGVADALPAAADMYDFLMNLQDELKEKYTPGAKWMLHRKTKTKVRQVKDNDGQYIWERGIKEGAPNILLGQPVATNSYFPVIAANALPIAYGDLKRAYYIIDRIGIRILRDPYTNKPFVQFYMTKRVGSMHVNSEALKVVECAA